ncbi:hypothetical protein TNCV_3221951 [Trichonephila clavipes]|nr:hypothetical protein TNCV_3221951 [Trichonephila clavipes]
MESGRLQRRIHNQLGSDDNRVNVWRCCQRLNLAFGLQGHRGHNATLQWIPSHYGIKDNEFAHTLVKAGFDLP